MAPAAAVLRAPVLATPVTAPHAGADHGVGATVTPAAPISVCADAAVSGTLQALVITHRLHLRTDWLHRLYRFHRLCINRIKLSGETFIDTFSRPLVRQGWSSGLRLGHAALQRLVGLHGTVTKVTIAFLVPVDAPLETLGYGGTDAWHLAAAAGAAALLLHQRAVLGTIKRRANGLAFLTDTLGAAGVWNELLALLRAGSQRATQRILTNAGTLEAALRSSLHRAYLRTFERHLAVSQRHAVTDADSTRAISAGHRLALFRTHSALCGGMVEITKSHIYNRALS